MSVNSVTLLGNLGKDPEVKTVGNGSKVANLTLATTDRAYKKQDGTEVPEKTEWHNITAWRGLAELAEKYMVKGQQIYVEGKLTTDVYEKDGVKHYSTKIIADVIQLLGKRDSGVSAQEVTVDVVPTADENDLPF